MKVPRLLPERLSRNCGKRDTGPHYSFMVMNFSKSFFFFYLIFFLRLPMLFYFFKRPTPLLLQSSFDDVLRFKTCWYKSHDRTIRSPWPTYSKTGTLSFSKENEGLVIGSILLLSFSFLKFRNLVESPQEKFWYFFFFLNWRPCF